MIVDFASTIRAARQEQHLTLQQMATKIGTSKGYCSGIEQKKVNPPAPRLTKKLAKLFGLDETRLLVLAFIEKAPKQIRELVREALLEKLEIRQAQGNPTQPLDVGAGGADEAKEKPHPSGCRCARCGDQGIATPEGPDAKPLE